MKPTGASRTASWSTTARGRTSPPTRTTATSNCSSSTRRCPRPTAASTCAAPRRCRSGTPPRSDKFNLRADKGSGGLWNNSPGAPGKDPLVLADKPFGEWNHFRIVQVGVARHRLAERQARRRSRPHGELLRPQDARRRQRGPIQLQTHGGEIRWRNIFLREIPRRRGQRASSPATARGLRAASSTARTSPAGTGRSSNYEVDRRRASSASRRRAARSTPRSEYGDFTARLEFKLPPAATTAWRSATRATATPPTSACANSRCSTTLTPKYAKLDPRQCTRLGLRHGAGPPRLPAARSASGTSRRSPSRARRSRSELNGTVILDCDLAKVTEFMDNQRAPRQGPHPRPLRLRRPQRPGRVPEHPIKKL